jgi:hypothetical protein
LISSISWTGILLIVAVLAVLAMGLRMSHGGWIVVALKGILVMLIVLVLGIVAWNTATVFYRPK